MIKNKRNFLLGGDIRGGRGNGGESIYGETFHDETFVVKHNQRGILGEYFFC
jgi:cyclophilin family peptidyl-prolyl cis-trans isomerase